MKEQIITIFDTTLRDGQQCPGAGMSLADNLAYAKLAAKAGIDVLEAGFPAASQCDFDAVHTIAKCLAESPTQTTIAALCQLREAQIERTMEALAPAKAVDKARLHTYLPVDPHLMAASLGKLANEKDQLIKDVYNFIQVAVSQGFEVEFSAEGYSRMAENKSFVTEVFRAAISAGASVINCPDTIGGACRWQGNDYFVHHMREHAALMAKEFSHHPIVWSVHCHNDFGLALDNTLQGVFQGPATQIEGCINGIGERAGNVSIEQCVMVLRHFGDKVSQDKRYLTQVKPELLQQLSDFVAEHMLPRQPHWPINGNNAAKHTSGGHTNAILQNPLAYQPFDPKEVGKTIGFVFGPLSGGNHAQAIIRQQGYRCDDAEKAAIAQAIKHYYHDRRKGVTDDELMQAYFAYRAPIVIENMDYRREGHHSVLEIIGQFFDSQGKQVFTRQGNDSALATLHQAVLTKMPGVDIDHYRSEAIGKGINAKSQATIVVHLQDKQYSGVGVDQDIELSALRAFIAAVNQAYIAQHYAIAEEVLA